MPHALVAGVGLSIALAGSALSGCGPEPLHDGNRSTPSKNIPGDPGSGTLYGLSQDGPGNALVQIDLVMGSLTTAAALPDGVSICESCGQSAIDASRHRYFYIDGFNQRLVTIDLASGTVIANVPLSADVFGLGVVQATGALLCQSFLDSKTGLVAVDQLDVMTGAVEQLSTYAAADKEFAISSVFDGTDTYFSIIGDASTSLASVNVVTGSTTKLSLPSELSNLQFDPEGDRLFAFNPNEKIVTIDRHSAEVSTLAKPSYVGSLLTGDMAFDAATHRYFFVGASDYSSVGGSEWTTGDQIFTLDADSGQVLANPSIASLHGVYNIQISP